MMSDTKKKPFSVKEWWAAHPKLAFMTLQGKSKKEVPSGLLNKRESKEKCQS